MEKTIFERIIDREVPAHIVYEDDTCIAFLDKSPVSPGHTLVVPKTPFRNALDTPDNILCHLIITAKKIGTALQKGLDAEGVNIIANNESAAGQVIFYTHLHVIPRFSGDGHTHWKQGTYKNKTHAQQTAERLRDAL